MCGGFGGEEIRDCETKNTATLCYGHEKKFVQKVIQWKSLEWLWSEWLESEERVCKLGKLGVMNIFLGKMTKKCFCKEYNNCCLIRVTIKSLKSDNQTLAKIRLVFYNTCSGISTHRPLVADIYSLVDSVLHAKPVS